MHFRIVPQDFSVRFVSEIDEAKPNLRCNVLARLLVQQQFIRWHQFIEGSLRDVTSRPITSKAKVFEAIMGFKFGPVLVGILSLQRAPRSDNPGTNSKFSEFGWSFSTDDHRHARVSTITSYVVRHRTGTQRRRNSFLSNTTNLGPVLVCPR